MDAAEKGVEIEPHPGGEALLVIAKKIIEADNDKATAQEADPMAQQQPQQPMM
jgi:hypothetical protein